MPRPGAPIRPRGPGRRCERRSASGTSPSADQAFHATIVDAAGNEILAELYQRLRDRQLRMGETTLRLSPRWAQMALTEHAVVDPGGSVTARELCLSVPSAVGSPPGVIVGVVGSPATPRYGGGATCRRG
ncbi:FCD domain-containing protein [Micromonospora radicis]|uniref:FCD domain-containing protein n=1 Tax=Micromonospora radicis TaxID=1894971 RepID=UPI001F1AF123|nr:FCD domain-containing protein [Micromonospora radicis]